MHPYQNIFVEYDGSEDENWGYSINGYTISKPVDSAQTSATNIGYSNQAVRSGATSMPNGTFRIGASNLVTRLATGDNDVSTFKAWLSNNPMQLVYPLATPIVIDMTPTIINVLNTSECNILSNSGKLTVSFKANIQGYIDSKLSNRSVSNLRNSINIEDTKTTEQEENEK